MQIPEEAPCSETGQVGVRDLAAAHQHLAVLGAAVQRGDDLARVEQGLRIERAFDPQGLLNPGKVIPTLHRCAEYGKMLVRAGQIKHPDLPRF